VKGWKKYSVQMDMKRKLVLYSYQTKKTHKKPKNPIKQRPLKDKEGHFLMIKGSIQKADIPL